MAAQQATTLSPQSAFWALVALMFNCMAQPLDRFLGLGHPFAILLARACPDMCLLELIGSFAAITKRMLCNRSGPIAEFKILARERTGRKRPQKLGLAHHVAQILVLAMAAIQLVKLYATRGVEVPTFIATIYALSYAWNQALRSYGTSAAASANEVDDEDSNDEEESWRAHSFRAKNDYWYMKERKELVANTAATLTWQFAIYMFLIIAGSIFLYVRLNEGLQLPVSVGARFWVMGSFLIVFEWITFGCVIEPLLRKHSSDRSTAIWLCVAASVKRVAGLVLYFWLIYNESRTARPAWAKWLG